MSDLISRQDVIDALKLRLENDYVDATEFLAFVKQLPSAEPERTAKVKLLDTGLQFFVFGECECGRQVEKPRRGNDGQRGAFYCPRCGAKLEWE